MRRFILLLSLLALVLLAACGAPTPTPQGTSSGESDSGAQSETTGGEAQHIQVQHILIGFAGAGGASSVPGKDITRTQEEARALAYSLLEQAQNGANFDELVVQNTDDAPPGIYGMSNSGVEPAEGEFSRDEMVGAFGNVGFSLQPGEVGIADFNPVTSPYGWHVIKRLK